MAYLKLGSDMMSYKEIVTKAVISKGKKKYKNNYQISVENNPSTILGCWIINHNFEATEKNNNVIINGSFDVNIWYSYENDTKTTVATQKITYQEEEKMNLPDSNITGKDIVIRCLKQPSCISAKESKNIITIEIEKELGIEIIGDINVKISSLDDTEEVWDNLDGTKKNNDAINGEKINTEYIKEEIVK